MKHLSALLIVALIGTSSASVFFGYSSLQTSRRIDQHWDAQTAAPGSATRFTDAEVALSRGQAALAATIYRGSLAEGLSQDERLAANLGLAQAAARLGLEQEARSALQAALESAGRPESPRELLAMADRAYQSGAWRATRQLLSASLLLEDDPRVNSKTLARARLRLGDTYRRESKEELSAESSSSWTAWLNSIDPSAVPEVRVHTSAGGGVKVDLEAQRVGLRRVLRTLLRRLQPGTALPTDLEDVSIAVTAKLRLRPAAVVLRRLAALGGLDYELREGRHWIGPLPSSEDPDHAGWARTRARESYLRALSQDGVPAPDVHLQLAEVDLADGRTEEGIERLQALTERWPDARVCRKALLALAGAEAQMLRLARSRAALFRLLDRRDSTDLAPAAFLELARSFLAEGRDEDGERAAAHLLRAFPKSPQVPAGRLLLGKLALDHGRLPEVIEILDPLEASENPSLRRSAVLLMAQAHLAAGDPTSGAALLRPLIPTSILEGQRGPEILLLYAESERAGGGTLQALLAYRTLARYHPDSAEGAKARAAIPPIRHRLGLLPSGSPRGMAEIEDAARSWLNAGEPGRARTLLLGLESPTPPQQVLLADCELQLGRAKAALELLRALPPVSGGVRVHASALLAQALRRLGRTEELSRSNSRSPKEPD
ncbi:MAG: tetratricopeptide repeat protein [Planctomycetes bacterium]|nr:tetratricopeptide repeat protein [Planctomycetota bacterium]